jgi:hypothetical protein
MAKSRNRLDDGVAPSGTSASSLNHDQTAGHDSSNDPETVARRAYERFQARGAEHGRDQEDWFEAERELRGERLVPS